MSYELNFWRYKAGITLDHQSVYECLSDGNTVDGVDNLPIEQMIRRVFETFSGWQQLDEFTYDGGARGSFQVTVTPQSLRVDCYGMDGEDMNRFIEIANEFKCPLYDPQTGQRFDSA